jgi:polyisoprenoid-binding protein YceI
MEKSTHRLVLLLLVFSPWVAFSQHYAVSDKGSKVEFRVNYNKNGAEIVKGSLGGIKGNIVFDPAHPEKASFDVTVNTATVKTGVAERDNELKHEDFFSQSLYPVIRIKSTAVAADGASGVIYILHGYLTMKGGTKPVNIQFTATPAAGGYLFRGSFHLNRLDYHLCEKGPINNDVSIFIELKGVKK